MTTSVERRLPSTRSGRGVGRLTLVLAAASAVAGCKRDGAGGQAPIPPVVAAPVQRDAAKARVFTCGDEHEHLCPLQAFMNNRLSQAARARRWREAAALFEQLATVAPEGFPRWIEFAQNGREATLTEDPEKVKAVCISCHETYEVRYRAELRDRPLPEAVGRLP
jgi:hypothetical protein